MAGPGGLRGQMAQEVARSERMERAVRMLGPAANRGPQRPDYLMPSSSHFAATSSMHSSAAVKPAVPASSTDCTVSA